MQTIQVWFLGQEDPMEKGRATYSSILALRIPWVEETGGWATVHGVTESDMSEWQTLPLFPQMSSQTRTPRWAHGAAERAFGAAGLVLKRRDAGTDRGDDDGARPLGPGAELNLGDKVLGEVGKYNFIALQAKGDTGAHALKTMCPNLGGFAEELYSSGSRWGFW